MSASGALTDPQQSERLCYDSIWAVICGVTSYEGWRAHDAYGWAEDVTGVPESVTRMQSWLTGLGAEVILPRDPANATAAQIVQCVDDLRLRLADAVQRGERPAAIVYLAGHARQNAGVAHFLAARESSDRYLARDQIWLGRLRSEFAAILSQAHHLLFIVDCCYAGCAVPPQAGAVDGRVIRECLRHQSVQVAVACRADCLAAWTPRDGMLFTRAFLDHAELVERPGIPLSEFMSGVKRDAAVECQFPYFWSGNPLGGDFIIGLPTRSRVVPSGVPLEKAIQEVRGYITRAVSHGIKFTRHELVNSLREQGTAQADVAVDALIQNGLLEQRFDDYLHLQTPVEKKPEEQRDD